MMMIRKCLIVLCTLLMYLNANAQDSTNRFPRTGNVGIGTMNPGAKLDVVGTGRFNTDGVNSPNPIISMYSPDSHFLLLSTSFGQFNYSGLVGPGDQGIIYSGGSMYSGGTGSNSAFVIAPWSSGSDGLRISSSGDVSIGSISTGGAKLAVNGTGLFTKVIVKDITKWPDYVFGDTYQLPSLQDVEKFILDNKRLPGIPAADVVAKEGQDLADMQVQQMQKIEELTLYVIQLNKKLAEQELRIKELEQHNSKKRKR